MSLVFFFPTAILLSCPLPLHRLQAERASEREIDFRFHLVVGLWRFVFYAPRFFVWTFSTALPHTKLSTGAPTLHYTAITQSIFCRAFSHGISFCLPYRNPPPLPSGLLHRRGAQ